MSGGVLGARKAKIYIWSYCFFQATPTLLGEAKHKHWKSKTSTEPNHPRDVIRLHKNHSKCRTSLAVQWLSLLSAQGAWFWSLVGKLRSHMPCGLARRKTRMTTNGTIIIGQTQEDPCLGVTWNDFLRWPFCSESTVKNCLSLGLRWWLFSG